MDDLFNIFTIVICVEVGIVVCIDAGIVVCAEAGIVVCVDCLFLLSNYELYLPQYFTFSQYG